MPEPDAASRPQVTLPEAAALLHLPVEVVASLAEAGYLEASKTGAFPLVDLKAFLARNADNGSGNLLDAFQPEAADPQALLDALDGKSEEMARRAFDIFATAFPEATGWSLAEQARFIEQARARFEAILAVTGQGAEVDEALVGDLQDVGASAAWEGSPLPQLLVVLRISRDLVVQTAVELAEEGGRHWGLALSLLLTRVLPAMDRLTDSLAQGYWAAMIGREEESRARYEHVVEHSSDGIWEVDLEGRIQYANPALAIILGRRLDQLEGARLAEVLKPVDGGGSLSPLMSVPDSGSQRLELTILRADGVRRVLDVTTMARIQEGELVGFEGIARDVTATHDLEADKNEFLALVTYDLRNPLTTILGLGATLESHPGLPDERIRRMGGSIRRHAERISRLADDLYDISRIEASALLLTRRPVELAQVVDDALGTVADASDVRVVVPEGLHVQADPRRLEQVVANLVENALEHGAPPVRVELVGSGKGSDASVQLVVTDAGPGVHPSLVPTLFSRVRTLSRSNRDRSRGTGLGLSLVRGLVEAMGGRVWYEPGEPTGARFIVTLPVPGRRTGDGLLDLP
ncbi:MAG: PAS domain S-box protein [Actinobacteria bacterium]|nr:PAS domain S-box protein [Actinomycetota bacterium]MBV9934317.1 PAS domain S-box protein [Actinomycetota bacterium]